MSNARGSSKRFCPYVARMLSGFLDFDGQLLSLDLGTGESSTEASTVLVPFTPYAPDGKLAPDHLVPYANTRFRTPAAQNPLPKFPQELP